MFDKLYENHKLVKSVMYWQNPVNLRIMYTVVYLTKLASCYLKIFKMLFIFLVTGDQVLGNICSWSESNRVRDKQLLSTSFSHLPLTPASFSTDNFSVNLINSVYKNGINGYTFVTHWSFHFGSLLTNCCWTIIRLLSDYQLYHICNWLRLLIISDNL